MYVGIDIGGTNIKGILTDANGNIYSFKELSTPDNPQLIDESILNLIEILATSATISKIDIKAIGIGVAGTIDKKKGTVITSNNIAFAVNHPLVKRIEKATGVKVILENDSTIALIGGWWKGNGNKFQNWLMLTFGTGIGGGAIIDNKIYSGQNGNSLEVGHMVIDYNGIECSCGSRGCWERYASATALVERTKTFITKKKYKSSTIVSRIKEEELTAKIIYEEALKNDELAVMMMREQARFIGMGVTNLVNIFNPEAIIFGGGLSQAYKLIIPIVKQTVKEHALKGLKESVKFFPIKDQAQIPALGAARLAIDSVMGLGN